MDPTASLSGAVEDDNNLIESIASAVSKDESLPQGREREGFDFQVLNDKPPMLADITHIQFISAASDDAANDCSVVSDEGCCKDLVSSMVHHQSVDGCTTKFEGDCSTTDENERAKSSYCHTFGKLTESDERQAQSLNEKGDSNDTEDEQYLEDDIYHRIVSAMPDPKPNFCQINESAVRAQHQCLNYQGDHDSTEIDNLNAAADTPVKVSTKSTFQAKLTAKAKEVENETESEDEPPRWNSRKTSKQRLEDIEYAQSPLQEKRKRLRFSDGDIVPTKTQKVYGVSNGISPDASLPIDSADTTQAFEEKYQKARLKQSSSRKKSKRSVSQERKQVIRSAGSVATLSSSSSTFLRRSHRKSNTNTQSLSARRNEGEFGRPKVIFSSTSTIVDDKRKLSTIQKLGGTIVTDINEADILCIGTGNLKKTGKLIMAIATGKDIVTDEWVRRTHADQRFVGCREFLPIDNEHEKAWGFSLSEALERGKRSCRPLDNICVFLTAQLRKDLGNLCHELVQIASALGAEKVMYGLPQKTMPGRVVVVGSTKHVDPQGSKVGELGYKMYGQDLLTMAALRGKVELESAEFVIPDLIKDESHDSP